MSEIQVFPFAKDSLDRIKAYKFDRNWPVVYVLENSRGHTSVSRSMLDQEVNSTLKTLSVGS